MDEDAIDTEALQAQIDLSMSFAQNLVSSWIQPHKIPRNSHKKNLEKELSEYMQRPARLGVGASIPEGYNSATRETARLKGKLAGTKHSREEEDDMAPKQPSDGEGESRAIAIKKKPKYDPFDVGHKDANPQLITASSNVAQLQATISPEEAHQPLDGHNLNSPTLSTSRKKKKRKKLNAENGAHDVEGSETGVSPAIFRNGSSSVLSPSLTPKRRSAEELDSIDAVPNSQRTVDVSLTSTPALNMQNQHGSIPLDFLTRPLLNLEPRDDPDYGHEGTSSSPKKKRKKRRRKKKSSLIPTVDNKIDETSNVS